MSVQNGQPVNAAINNAANMSRLVDTSTSGKVDVNNVTDSTSSTTGALHTTGGLGVEKSAVLGANLAVTGITNLTGTLNSNGITNTGNITTGGGTVTAGIVNAATSVNTNAVTTNSIVSVTSTTSGSTVNGNELITGLLNVTGAAALASSLAVSGNQTIGGTLAVTGAETIGGTLTVTGATTFNSGTTVTGLTTLTGAATVSSTLAVTGATTLSSGVTVTGSAAVSGNQTIGGSLTITGDLVIQGTNTTVNSANLTVTDKNITVNSGGTAATSEGAGLTVDRVGTKGSIIYANASASRFKIGDIGLEKEIVDVSSAQTLTNKTLTSPVITTPTGILKSDLALGNVDNTSDSTKNSAAVSLTNKTINASLNTITNITDTEIATAANIALSKLVSLTVSKAAVTDASGKITTSTTSATELGFVAGVTSSIQAQISAKQDAASAVTLTGTQTLTNKTLTAPVINSPTGITKTDVGLSAVDNTSDATKNSTTTTLTNKTISGAANTITNVSLTTAITGTLPIANGGTNAATANAALNNLLPTQTGNATKALTTDGTNASWVTVASSGGSSTSFTTGDVKLTLKTTADINWVMANDGTIGNVSSGGTTRANADTSDLFTLIWTNIPNTYAAVTGGRGTSAAADFAANKTIALTKMLGRSIAIAGTGSGLSARALGQALGEENHTLTQAELASHTHIQDAHNHSAPLGLNNPTNDPGVNLYSTDPGYNYSSVTGYTAATNQYTGGNAGHNTMQPTSFLNVMIKL